MLLANVFHAIRVEYEAGSVPTNIQNLVKGALDLAKEDVDQLSMIISELTRKLSRTNGNLGIQWRKVQVTLKSSKIEKFKDNLESVKSTMNLLQISRNQSSIIQVISKLDILDTKFSSVAITSTSSSHQITNQSSPQLMQNHSVSPEQRTTYTNIVSKSIKEYRTSLFLGAFRFRTTSTTRRYDDDDFSNDADNSTTTRDYLVEFPIGFTTCRKGFRATAKNSFNDYGFNVIRQRPYDSKIFRFCKNDDTGAVKRLLDRGEASIYDVNEVGQSLLHIAAVYAYPKLCQTLLDRGADVYLRDNFGFLPIDVATEEKQSESFISICEVGGYDPWPSDKSLFPYARVCNSISVWRYIYQVKQLTLAPNHSFETAGLGIMFTGDIELVDFLVPRVTAKLYQDGNSAVANHYLRWRRDLMMVLFSNWLESICSHWFSGHFVGKPLCEYKLIQVLKQISSGLNANTNEERHSVSDDFFNIYKCAIERIISSYRWSIEIAIAVFRRWSRIIVDSGVDLTSYITSQDTNLRYTFRGHTVSCCKEIQYEIVHEGQHGNLSLNITTKTLPKFSNLDPNFLCENGLQRRDSTGAGRCISQIDETFIEDGKFSMKIPGQWEEPLVPNSNLELLLSKSWTSYHGISYRLDHKVPPYNRSRVVTKAEIQQLEEDLRNGTLLGLEKD